MKYKALITDIDGTLIINGSMGFPTSRVLKAIHEAKLKGIHVGLATARPYKKVKPLFDVLELSGPSILSGGAQLINAPYETYYYERTIDQEIVKSIGTILSKMNVKFWIQDNGDDFDFTNTYKLNKPFVIVIHGVDEEIFHKIRDKVPPDAPVVFHTVTSPEKNKIDIHITDPLATKQYGILEIAKILNISTDEIIGIGDSNNDYPLLMACGLKVAMGNATEELKAIADYIAPTVNNDGIAQVISKFILNG